MVGEVTITTGIEGIIDIGITTIIGIIHGIETMIGIEDITEPITVITSF